MKGVSLLSDMFLMFALAAIVILMVTFIYYLWLARGVESALGMTGPQKIAITLFFKPVKYDSAFLSFLELNTTDDGIPMKVLLEQAAIQNSTKVWINGETIDVSAKVNELLPKMINSTYILKITEPEIVIAEKGSSKSFEKTTVKLFLLDGKYRDLELYVG
jgi:hypothetical protein